MSVPFSQTMGSLRAPRKLGVRQILIKAMGFASVLASVLMIWKGLGLWCNTASPIVVVLSGSMEPAFYRGDLLFLTNLPTEPFEVGDITVYQLPGGGTPVVHRVIEAHDDFSADNLSESVPGQLLLTKGDSNPADDISLFLLSDRNLHWLKRSHVIRRVKGFLPYVGYVTIAMNGFPSLKYVLLDGLGFLALLQRQ